MNQPQWHHLETLQSERLADAQERLEIADEKNFKFEQGRLSELHFSLDLGKTVHAVLRNQTRSQRISSV